MVAEQTQKGSGMKTCMLVGCSLVFVLFVIVGVFVYIGVKGVFDKYVEKYTDVQARDLPRVTLSEEAIEAVIERADKFAEGVKGDRLTEPLVLSSDDINALIQHHPNWKGLSDKVYVSLEEDKIQGEVSIPLEEMSSMLKGRYLNASAVFTVSLMNGRLLVFLDSAEVKGQPIPEPFMQEMRKENLAKNVASDPNMGPVIEKLESIEVIDGKLTIRAKGS